MTSSTATVEDLLATLPDERRAHVSALRDVILASLPAGYEEYTDGKMIHYVVPKSIYPKGYHANPKQTLPFASIASQKNCISLYLMFMYADSVLDQWFRAEWAKSGKKLDMGKSCLRSKKVDDLALDVIGEAFARAPLDEFVARYDELYGDRKKR
ncbi:MAG TPA: DUF1801 domain-containing protein [Deinococcales bacterium]|nr:DUF1801 domain-containing protein [Deinococcales bacterium]